MRNITAPRTVSFEEALRNLASRLTGVPASTLPRTQEGIVQFMAENLPPAIDVDGLAEAVTAEVIARLGKDAAEATKDTTDAQNGSQKVTGAAKRNKTKSTD